MSLLNVVFMLYGINLVLRGGHEHCGLKLSHFTPLVKWEIQMILHLNWPFFRFDEHGSKNRAGGSKQLNLDNKSITQFARKDSVSQCHYNLIQKYVLKLPPTAVTKDLFYCKPMHFKDSIPSDRPWYTDVPI